MNDYEAIFEPTPILPVARKPIINGGAIRPTCLLYIFKYTCTKRKYVVYLHFIIWQPNLHICLSLILFDTVFFRFGLFMSGIPIIISRWVWSCHP